MIISLADYLTTQVQKINNCLSALLPEKMGDLEKLYLAARYSLLGPGKRIRPLLVLAVNEALGGDSSKALIPACTLEFIHAYSLIHDDLPCMDNDDFRRGRPTLHRAFSEGHAVLTGDFLLTYAFEVLVSAPQLTAEQKMNLVATLAQRSGGEGMVGGQVMDIAAEGQSIDLAHLKEIHYRKTGALITAAVEFGGIIANADVDQKEILRFFGERIGLAFQIIDDVIDVTAGQQKHGRVGGSDVVNNKTTYVSLMGVESAKKMALNLLEEACQKLEGLKGPIEILRSLAAKLVNRQT